ncbi:hypothetical protein ACSLBF_20270 (plasmid) [Pseudoalteromonas sp. T1lg65]|uniref:hypothetical protein n=1 Tax=Pseudoalteromonas sp. T1lg65 TaxID=2077101 RepID=UPI003F7AEFC4
MKKTRTNPLVGHFTLAAVALAFIWLFVDDSDMLLVFNSLVLVYVVAALGHRMLKSGNKKKK